MIFMIPLLYLFSTPAKAEEAHIEAEVQEIVTITEAGTVSEPEETYYVVMEDGMVVF